MKQHKNLLERIVSASDLESEALPGQPLVELVGSGRVLIENHFGVLQYSNNEICVKVNDGMLNIVGDGLELAHMTKEQLIITGQIECIRVCNRRQ